MIYAHAVKLSRLLKSDDDFRDECVASSQSIDGDGDIIFPGGWDLSRVAAGQCKLLDSHDKNSITSILGNVEAAIVQDKALHCSIVWAASASPLAQFAMKMSRGGFLNGFSVGFVPKAIATLDDIRDEETGRVIVAANRRLWDAACAAMSLDPVATGEKARRIIVKQELCELSALGVPSNPDAMLKALTAGAVKEEDFARIGVTTMRAFIMMQHALVTVLWFSALLAIHYFQRARQLELERSLLFASNEERDQRQQGGDLCALEQRGNAA